MQVIYYRTIKSPLLSPVSPTERVLRANNRLNANNKSRTVRPQYRTVMDDRRKENEKDRNDFSSVYATVNSACRQQRYVIYDIKSFYSNQYHII